MAPSIVNQETPCSSDRSFSQKILATFSCVPKLHFHVEL
jgi:hypothetical protein